MSWKSRHEAIVLGIMLLSSIQTYEKFQKLCRHLWPKMLMYCYIRLLMFQLQIVLYSVTDCYIKVFCSSVLCDWFIRDLE